MSAFHRIAPRGWLFAFALLTVLVYWAGLGGGFALDDYPNIVDNVALRVDGARPSSWIEAAWASPASDLRRPLASLSFALNYVTSGLEPGPMKATNLLIHLVNGALLFVLMRRLVVLAGAADDSPRARWLPVLVAGAWLVHPINLAAVLYVVQRMESLANLFVLAALIVYIDARTRPPSRRASLMLWLGVPLLTGIGVLAKESAVLVPLYALLIELALPRFAQTPWREKKGIVAFFVVFLALPGIAGLARLLPRYLAAEAYAIRPFTLAERLLTEPRVLMDYIGWTLVPMPTSFSLYRDDFPISHGLLDPWTTLPALLGIVAIALAAVLLRRCRPLVALGLAWFLAAHLLTATFIPLELVYEHRNYFASAAILLAAFDLVLPVSATAAAASARYAAVAALIALCVFSTTLRAIDWSNPVRFEMLEAARHPDSPRATYGLGRALLIASRYDTHSPLLAQAREALEHAARVPRATAMPDVALIQLAAHTHTPIERRWLDDLTAKLGARTPTIEDAAAVRSLTECVNEGICEIADSDLLHVYLAAVTHPRPDPAVLYSYAIFAYRRLHDTELALTLARAAADGPPVDPQYRLNLVNFLISLGRRGEASAELERLRRQGTLGRFASGIVDAQRRIDAMPPAS